MAGTLITHTLHICNHTGDTVLAYDAASPELITEVEAAFNEALPGRMAYRVDGDERTQIRAFDPTAPQIVMIANLVGG